MSARVSGDFAQLRRLVAGMGKLNTAAFRRETSALLAEDMLERVQSGFERSTDPYGKPWAPIKHRSGKPLIDTSVLRNSIQRRATGTGFSIETNVVYAAIHNYGGTVRRPPTVNAHARSGRFKRKSGGRGKSTRVSFSPAFDVTVTRRQFLPDADRLPASYRSGFERVLLAQRKRYLGR